MPERVITLAVSDADWKALRAVQPEPIDWLKKTIRDAIDRGPAAADRAAGKVAGGGRAARSAGARAHAWEPVVKRPRHSPADASPQAPRSRPRTGPPATLS